MRNMDYQPPLFQSLRYFPPEDRDMMLDLAVSWVDAVAHQRLATGGNHWCFYLRVGNDNSVCVDLTPSYSVPSVSKPGGSKGIMIVSYLECAMTNSATKAVRVDVRPGSKVRDFVSLLVNQRRHQYEFNSEGQGCRYWIADQMALFQNVGLFVNGSQITEARNAIRTQYPDQIQYPLVVGSYYT